MVRLNNIIHTTKRVLLTRIEFANVNQRLPFEDVNRDIATTTNLQGKAMEMFEKINILELTNKPSKSTEILESSSSSLSSSFGFCVFFALESLEGFAETDSFDDDFLDFFCLGSSTSALTSEDKLDDRERERSFVAILLFILKC